MLEGLEVLEVLEESEVKRCAEGHFVVGRFTVVIVEQLPQAATAAFPQRL